jgi:cysteinyl-tRNA synthetase
MDMTEIKLQNTLTGKKEIFKPLKEKEVSFYQCGPTVYWTQHIGNLRAMTMADIINRTFQYLDYKVKFVRNYTDVGHLTSDNDEGEDKMSKGAEKEGLSPKEIADKYIAIFEKDNSALNNLEPTIKPKATENINEVIEMVKIMLEKGYAYQTELAIYFDITKASEYNCLSHQDLEKQKVLVQEKLVITIKKIQQILLFGFSKKVNTSTLYKFGIRLGVSAFLVGILSVRLSLENF